MLRSMRSNAKYILWFVIAAFVIGFVFVELGGLLGRPKITPGTTVAEVNGQDITQQMYTNAYENLMRQQQEAGQTLNQDEIERLKDQAFDQLVNDILLRQEIERRGITVSDDEIRQYALNDPPPDVIQNPNFQTDGQFDLAKYQRFIQSPVAQQQGITYSLSQYYRSRIPESKLYEQIASTVYISDAQLWRAYQDQHDSAQVSFVRFDPSSIPDSAVRVSDEEIRAYFEQHEKELPERRGSAVVSVTRIDRPITPADTARVRDRILQLRAEIAGGTSFADVAKRESVDSTSAVDGGSLGWIKRGMLVKPFEDVAFSLPPKQLSQPVLTQFGYHLIQVDQRAGDSVLVRHILLPIAQGDSSAARSDQEADVLARLAASASEPAQFDSAVRQLHLPSAQLHVQQGEPLVWNGAYVPGGSAFAFSGVNIGTSSELTNTNDAYYLVRLDSLHKGGKATLDDVRDEIRSELALRKKLDLLLPRAQQLATAATSSSLDAAAKAAGLAVEQTPMFSRVSTVNGLGQLTQAIGAAFALPVGAVSAPIRTPDAVVVLRVDRRVSADRDTWVAQRDTQRAALLPRLRQRRVQEFVANLRATAEIVDRRREIEAIMRRSAA
ncbi:MAG TPA: SurA N-terminal domain-containing protein [Gemmatimonadaceae bacterium]|nr:SurA N-terminal domain-containing protein [Gemmatimonadaceae bacterium]